MIARYGVEFALDTPEAVPLGLGRYLLKGWCFARNSTDHLAVSVQAGEVDIPAFLGLARPDVVKHFADISAAQCGFIVRFQCQPDVKSVSLMAAINGVRFLLVGDVPIASHLDTVKADPLNRSKASSYTDWIRRKEPDLFWRDDEIESQLAKLSQRPLISIVLPTYNTPPYFLKRCIESVLEQHYGNWQLCITDDASSDETVLSSLQTYAQRDGRIHVDVSAQQGGISAASNSCLKSAHGEFVVLLDHDDELHPHALLELARAHDEFPEADFFYSDEDKIDGLGVRSQPSFKPDFDQDIFQAFNYLGHMIGLRRRLVNELGGFHSSRDGAQDWDLLLRASEILHPAAIRHIRKLLYHWRMHPDSTAFNLDAKPYVAKAWTKTLEAHTTRMRKKAAVTEGLFYGSMRVKYPAPKHIEIGVFLRLEDGAFQRAIVKLNAARRVLHVYHTIRDAVFDLSAGGNTRQDAFSSLADLRGDLFVFINGPLESLNHLFFEELVAQGMREDCGLVNGISLDSRNRILATGFVLTADHELLDPYVGSEFPKHSYMGQLNVVRSIDACPETFFAVRREHLAAIGGLDALCSSHPESVAKRLGKNAIEKGLRILSTPYAVAAFSESCKRPLARKAREEEVRQSFRLNPQICSFQDASALMQEGLVYLA